MSDSDGGYDRRRRSRSRSSKRRSSSSRRRKKSYSRSRSPVRRSRSRSRSPYKDAKEDERDRNKDLYTVFVHQLHPKVDERDLFEFFSHVGRVSDIRLIRDSRSNKSKGLCYVEFWEKDSVNKAIALTGQLIGGYPITVQLTQAEKNRPQEEESSMRIYVGSLHSVVTEKDLRPVFEAFGPLDFIDLHKDPITNQSKGFGFVQYKKASDAKQALGSLNGLEIAGRPIKVGVVDSQMNTGVLGNMMPTTQISMPENIGELDDGTGGMSMSAQGRAELMQKLQRGPGAPGTIPIMPAKVPSMGLGAVSMAAGLRVPMIQPTTCVVLKNMFDSKTETDPDFDLDIKEDVEEEATKYGKLKHIFVDKNSAGNVFLRFENVDSAMKIVKFFNGRWFASRQITAEFVIETTYLMKFPKAQ